MYSINVVFDNAGLTLAALCLHILGYNFNASHLSLDLIYFIPSQVSHYQVTVKAH